MAVAVAVAVAAVLAAFLLCYRSKLDDGSIVWRSLPLYIVLFVRRNQFDEGLLIYFSISSISVECNEIECLRHDRAFGRCIVPTYFNLHRLLPDDNIK